MSMIFCFFLGVVLIISGNEINTLIAVPYGVLICNVAGGVLFTYSVAMFIKSIMKNESSYMEKIGEKLKDISEKSISSSQVKDILEQIQILNERQKNNEENWQLLNETVKRMESLYSDTATAMQVMQENVNEIMDKIPQISETIAEKEESTNNAILFMADEIRKSINIACTAQTDEIRKEVIKLTSIHESEKNELNELQNNLKEFSECVNATNEKITGTIFSLKASTEELLKTEAQEVRKLEGIFGNFNELPKEILETNDQLSNEINEYLCGVVTKIEELSDSMEGQDEKRTRSFERMIKEVERCLEENDENTSHKLQELGQQYLQFEKTINMIVQQMTQMSEQDYEIMRQFINE